MKQEEIEKLIDMPLERIAPLCTDQKVLTSVLSLAIQIGIGIGQRTAFTEMNTAFRGYNATTIKG